MVVTIEVCGVDDCSRQRPYHVESTGSRPITEVKLRRAGLVLAWVTGWEYPVLLTSFHLLFPHSSHQYTHARTRPFAHAPIHTHTRTHVAINQAQSKHKHKQRRAGHGHLFRARLLLFLSFFPFSSSSSPSARVCAASPASAPLVVAACALLLLLWLLLWRLLHGRHGLHRLCRCSFREH